eukprot:SAG11_NODE_644_length_7980_cov_112.535963_9_plen_39_part_00
MSLVEYLKARIEEEGIPPEVVRHYVSQFMTPDGQMKSM